jgi:hypothetical protein
MIYAFSPFMLDHLSHVHILTAGWIPLIFLFLHKFFSSGRFRHLLLFTLFFLLQALSNSYYALYLGLFVPLFVLYYTFKDRKFRDARFLAKLCLSAIMIAIIAAPFFLPYIAARQEIGHVREELIGATFLSFLDVGPVNRLYGRFALTFHKPEMALFPGFVALLLCFTGLRASFGRKGADAGASRDMVSQIPARRVMELLIVLSLIFFIFLSVTGIELNISVLSPHKIFYAILLLVFIRFMLDARFRKKLDEPVPFIYLLILVLAFLFTFGKSGPYFFLHKYVPGFDSTRVATRMHIFVMLSISVMAAFGFRLVLSQFKDKRKTLILCLTGFIIAIEYLSVPIPLQSIPAKDDIPAVYKWLSKQKGEFVIMELPLPEKGEHDWRIEARRVYYSAYHWKRSVNGFSGFASPLYGEMKHIMNGFPTDTALSKLRSLDVRYVIINSSYYEDNMPSENFKYPVIPSELHLDRMTEHDGIGFVGRFGDFYVYELLPESSRSLRERKAYPPGKLADWSAEYDVTAKSITASPRDIISIPLLVTNTSRSTWTFYGASNGRYVVYASYHIYTDKGEAVEYDGIRTLLTRNVLPGESVRLNVSVHAPEAQGDYILEITLVQEHVSWFEIKGVPPAIVRLKVE